MLLTHESDMDSIVDDSMSVHYQHQINCDAIQFTPISPA